MKQIVNDILLFIGLIFLTSIITVAIYSYYYQSSGLDHVSQSAYMVNGLLTQVLVFFGSFVLFLLITKQTISDLLWIKKPDGDWLRKTAIILLVAYLVAVILGYINGLVSELIPENSFVLYSQKVNKIQTEVLSSFEGLSILYPIIVVAVLPAIAEELVFRGFLLRKIYDFKQNRNTAIIISATVFALVHFQILNLLPIFFMGLILGYVYYESKNILYPILLHFLFNASQVILVQYINI